jgi:hypothetical protein
MPYALPYRILPLKKIPAWNRIKVKKKLTLTFMSPYSFPDSPIHFQLPE